MALQNLRFKKKKIKTWDSWICASYPVVQHRENKIKESENLQRREQPALDYLSCQ